MSKRSYDTFTNLLNVIKFLLSDTDYTAQELADALGTTRRNVYYYLEFLNNYGLKVERKGDIIYINPQSNFLAQIGNQIAFSQTEALLLYSLLDKVQQPASVVASAKRKLEHFYGLHMFADKSQRERQLRNTEQLNQAIANRKVAILHHYSSPHSHTVTNRAVEPFMMMDDGNSVRCFEISTGLNKTFKISRTERVEVVDSLNWSFANLHKQAYTDIFLFTGDERHQIQLRLGQLSYNILLEEYPQAKRYIEQQDESHWLLSTFVVSYLGVGRFVLGLSDDVEVLQGDGLREYLNRKVNQMHF